MIETIKELTVGQSFLWTLALIITSTVGSIISLAMGDSKSIPIPIFGLVGFILFGLVIGIAAKIMFWISVFKLAIYLFV